MRPACSRCSGALAAIAMPLKVMSTSSTLMPARVQPASVAAPTRCRVPRRGVPCSARTGRTSTCSTGLQRHQTSAAAKEIFDNYDWKTPEQGASTSVLHAASPLLAGVTGRYFEDNNEAELTTDLDGQTGVRPHALDPEAATRLWDVSLDLIDN